MVFFRDSPELFNPGAISLWFAIFAKFEVLVLVKFLAERAVAALGENGAFGAKSHPALEGVRGRTVFCDPGIVGGHSAHAPVFVVNYFCGRESWVNFNANFFGDFSQPFDNLT